VKTLAYGLGVGTLVAGSVGLVRRLALTVRSTDWTTNLMLLFVVPYYIAMGSTRHYFARYAIPLIPFLALFAADALEVAGSWVASRTHVRRAWVVMALAVAAVAQPLAWSVRHDQLLVRTDTRMLAKQWIEARVPSGAKFAVDWPVYSPPLSRDLFQVKEQGGLGLSKHTLDWYEQGEFDYLVTSSFVYGLDLLDSDQSEARAEFYSALDDRYELVAEITPYSEPGTATLVFDEIYGPATALWQRQRPGPLLRIYRLQHP
jgi:hypothetical protein